MRAENVAAAGLAVLSAVAVPVPEPVKQAVIAAGAAVVGWLTSLALSWLKKKLRLS